MNDYNYEKNMEKIHINKDTSSKNETHFKRFSR